MWPLWVGAPWAGGLLRPYDPTHPGRPHRAAPTEFSPLLGAACGMRVSPGSKLYISTAVRKPLEVRVLADRRHGQQMLLEGSRPDGQPFPERGVHAHRAARLLDELMRRPGDDQPGLLNHVDEMLESKAGLSMPQEVEDDLLAVAKTGLIQSATRHRGIAGFIEGSLHQHLDLGKGFPDAIFGLALTLHGQSASLVVARESNPRRSWASLFSQGYQQSGVLPNEIPRPSV